MDGIERYKATLDLAYALRRVQRDFKLDVIEARNLVDSGADIIALRFSGVETPICEIENEAGATLCFPFTDVD